MGEDAASGVLRLTEYLAMRKKADPSPAAKDDNSKVEEMVAEVAEE